MGVTRFPNGVRIGSQAGATALFQIGTQTVFPFTTGGTLLTAGGTIASGLNGAVTLVIASLASGQGTGCFTVSGYPVGTTGGSIGFSIANSSGAAATTAGTVAWMAVGTA